MDLALDHVGDDRFVLAGIGELQARPRFVAEITSGRRTWRCERGLRGFGQVINAVDVDSGERAARYVPRGFLHSRGIDGGEFRIGDNAWWWDSDRRRRFFLSYGEVEVAEFEIGTPPQPVLASLAPAAHSTPMLVLMCCYVVKLAVDS